MVSVLYGHHGKQAMRLERRGAGSGVTFGSRVVVNQGEQRMSYKFFLREKADKARLRDAENARKNRMEIVKALSTGQVSRRDLVKWGLFTTAGLLAPIGGLSPFVQSAHADGGAGNGIPTGMAPSPLFGVQAFSTPMPRFDVIARNPNPFGFL